MKRLSPDKIKKVLICRTDGLGDVILALPLAGEAKRIFKNAEICFFTRKYVKDLLTNYPHIDRLIYSDDYTGYVEKKELFKKEGFDLIINVFPRADIAFAGFFGGIKYRIGTAYRWYLFLYNLKVREHRKNCERHEADYNLNLLANFAGGVSFDKKFKFSYTSAEKNKLSEKLSEKGIGIGIGIEQKYIIIHPFSKGSAKDLSTEDFVKYISEIRSRASEYKIVLTGTSEERVKINSLLNSLENKENIYDTAGFLNLNELMILIDNSELFIANSTGPIHIAGALNKKIIGFYPEEKPMNAARWKPLSSQAVILSGKSTEGKLEINLDNALSESEKLLGLKPVK